MNNKQINGFTPILLVALAGFAILLALIIFYTLTGSKNTELGNRVIEYNQSSPVPVSESTEISDLETELETTTFSETELEAEFDQLESELQEL